MSDLRNVTTRYNYRTLPDGTRILLSGSQTRSFVTPVSRDHSGRQIDLPTSSTTSSYTYSTPHRHAQYSRVLSQDNPATSGFATSGQLPTAGWRPPARRHSQRQSQYQPHTDHRPAVPQPLNQYAPLMDRPVYAPPQTQYPASSAYHRRAHSGPYNQHSSYHQSQPQQYPFTNSGQSYQPATPHQPFIPPNLVDEPPSYWSGDVDYIQAVYNTVQQASTSTSTAVQPPVQPGVNKKKKHKKRRHNSRRSTR